MRRRTLAVIVAALVFALSAAFAASLGGLNAPSLGADVTVVASCHSTGLDVAFDTEFDSDEGEYMVTEVSLSTINAACDQKNVEILLLDADDNVLETLSAVYDDAADAGVLSIAANVEADELAGVAVLISD